jgi:7-cyano-7-deazaguanine synthase
MSEVLLLSGGIDSIALAYWRSPAFAITVDYGQKAFSGELRASDAVCRVLSISHRIIRCDIAALGSGDLSGAAALPIAPVTEWWPYRNQFLATVAAMAALAEGASALLFGTVSSDAQHADGSAEFMNNLDVLMSRQEGSIRILSPAIEMTSIELVHASGIPMDILGYAHSCHRDALACGDCRGCAKYLEVFSMLRA